MLAQHIDILRVRKTLGRAQWSAPLRFGSTGWRLDCRQGDGSIFISSSHHTGIEGIWTHASIAYTSHMPDYEDMALLHRAVWPDGYAYEVFAPARQHVNIHPFARHLWGRVDGAAALPEFGRYGTI